MVYKDLGLGKILSAVSVPKPFYFSLPIEEGGKATSTQIVVFHSHLVRERSPMHPMVIIQQTMMFIAPALCWSAQALLDGSWRTLGLDQEYFLTPKLPPGREQKGRLGEVLTWGCVDSPSVFTSFYYHQEVWALCQLKFANHVYAMFNRKSEGVLQKQQIFAMVACFIYWGYPVTEYSGITFTVIWTRVNLD